MKRIIGKKNKSVISDDLKFGRFNSNLIKSKLDRSLTIELECKKEAKKDARPRLGAFSNRKKTITNQLATDSNDSRQVIERPDVAKWLASRGARQKRGASVSQSNLGWSNFMGKKSNTDTLISQKHISKASNIFMSNRQRNIEPKSERKPPKPRVYSQNRSQSKPRLKNGKPENRLTFGKHDQIEEQESIFKNRSTQNLFSVEKPQKTRAVSAHKLYKVNSSLFTSKPPHYTAQPQAISNYPPTLFQTSTEKQQPDAPIPVAQPQQTSSQTAVRPMFEEKNRVIGSFGDLMRNPFDRETMPAEGQPALVSGREDVEKMRRLSRYSEDNPEEKFTVEFQEMQLNTKQKEKYGGLKSIMTPRFRSKRLSKTRKSVGVEDHDNITPSKKCKTF